MTLALALLAGGAAVALAMAVGHWLAADDSYDPHDGSLP